MKYLSENTDLMKEWNWDANTHLDPTKLTNGSGKKAWWICSKGHKWLASIKDRNSRNSKCPYCFGRKVLSGFNDLATTHPELAKEWNYEKNNPLLPNKIKAGSNKKVWWRCSNGHEWVAKVSLRTYLKRNCPYCNHHTVLEGFNDLATTNPELTNEWNYEKNAPLLPSQVFRYSREEVWWICPKGHEYKKSIGNKESGCGCPVCSKEYQTSFPEQAIFFYLSKYYKNVENRYLFHGVESDIFLKNLNISVEYDGGYFHTNIKKDITKIKSLSKLGIKTINIRDIRCPKIEVEGAFIYQRKNETIKDLETAIKFIFLSIDSTIQPNIDIERDRVAILQNFISYEKKTFFSYFKSLIFKGVEL